MKVVKIIGGLGNQMFQYAFYLQLKSMYPSVYLDIHSFDHYKLHQGFELQKVFDVEASYADKEQIKYFIGNESLLNRVLRKYLRLYKNNIIEQKDFSFQEDYLKNKGSKYYIGYWQSPLYFKDVIERVKSSFIFPALDQKNAIFLDQIKIFNLVSVHVRRGDYVNHELHGGICDLIYYKKSLRFIKNHVKNPLFLIFSNDISWCKENIKEKNIEYVCWNTGQLSFRDMQLMSLCEHNIIANSSFSWWGAWLNNNQNKIVVSPKKWFNAEKMSIKNLIPSNWIKI